MRLRSYEATDLTAITNICAVCNTDDALSMYMTRSHEKYWTSYRLGTLRWLRDKIAGPGTVAWVVVAEESDLPAPNPTAKTNAGDVIGWAIWTRIGKSERARKWQKPNETLRMKLEQLLFKAESKYYEHVPNTNPSWHKEHVRTIAHVLHDGWPHDIFDEAWELDGCYVDVDWHRRGVGSLLTQWGLQQGQIEEVPVVVRASPKGVGMYERNGFRRISGGEFDEFFEGFEGSANLIWEPKGVNERWWERAVQRKKEVELEKRKKSNAEAATKP